MRRVAAVDVPGRDLGDGDVLVGDRLLRPVVAEPAESFQRAGPAPVQGDDLATVLAIEAHEAVGLLDDAVRFAGHDVAIVGEADVHALAAAVQRQQQAVRFVGAGGPDGHRTLERRDGSPKCLEQTVTVAFGLPTAVAGDEGRDDLGVGRDGTREAQAVGHAQVGVVVDVAVQHPDDERLPVTAALLELLAVDRVGVGLGDDADAGPSGVAEHGDLGPLAAERRPQEAVGLYRGAQHSRVVAELADLGGRLVDERQRRPDELRGARLEQRIAGPLGQRGGHRRVIRSEVVVPDEHVDARRIAAAHLHAIDRRQRLLDGEVAGQRRRTGIPTGQIGDGAHRAQAVAAQRPEDVTQVGRRPGDSLQGVGIGVQ